MERLKGAARFMFVAIIILASNLMTYTFCVYGNNFYIYTYQESDSLRCEELMKLNLENLRADSPVAQSLHADAQTMHQITRSLKEGSDRIEQSLNVTFLQDKTNLSEREISLPAEDDGDMPTLTTDDCEPCQCNDSNHIIERIVYVRSKTPQSPPSCNYSQGQSCNDSPNQRKENPMNSDADLKTIFIITPTHERSTQKVDLTSMCHTLMHVPKVVWIIIEDAYKPTHLVTQLLQRCNVKIVHLVAQTSPLYRMKKGSHGPSKARGVEQRNAGLSWLRKHYSADDCNGVVYFGDDDNKYDLRLFDEIRKTKLASVWKVAWAGGILWEGPTCHNGRATSWHTAFGKRRALPVDMAAFAIHLCEIFKHPSARVGVNIHGHISKMGYLESDLLQHFTGKSKVECRGSEREVYVWHSHTRLPLLHFEKKAPSSKIET